MIDANYSVNGSNESPVFECPLRAFCLRRKRAPYARYRQCFWDIALTIFLYPTPAQFMALSTFRRSQGKEYTHEEKLDQIPTIHLNVIQAIKTLIAKAEDFRLDKKVHAKTSFEFVRNMSDFEVITPEVANSIEEVWLDPTMQDVWARRSEYQIIESVKYYFEKLRTISDPEYVPTKDDILYTRVRTSGIVTERYEIEKTAFEMYDVGGQKNERKKWIHCFDNVTAVIFVAAISEYDQNLYEDGSTNRMVSLTCTGIVV